MSKVEFGNYFKSLNINDQHVADEVFAEMVKIFFLNQIKLHNLFKHIIFCFFQQDKDKDGSLSKKGKHKFLLDSYKIEVMFVSWKIDVHRQKFVISQTLSIIRGHF